MGRASASSKLLVCSDWVPPRVVATAALAAWWALVDRGWRVVAPALPAVVVTGYVVWFAAVVLPGIV